MDNVRVELLNMPSGIRAMTIPDRVNMYYTIYLNARNSKEQNNISYLHEIEHIKNGDYEKNGNADWIEGFVHKGK